jgi:hypothetical protein
VRDLVVLFLHLLATGARLARSVSARSVAAESVPVKHQLRILNRSRKRSASLRPAVRVVAALCTAFTAGHPQIRHPHAEDTLVSTSMALMARCRQALLFAVLLGVASVVQLQPHAQPPTDVTGEWEASYQTPLGPQELKIYLTQEGPRISGHTSSEYGESQVRGTINSQDIQFTFQSTDGGRAIDVRVTAKVEGERMRGAAKIGDRAEGAFTAERTAS